MYVCMYICNDSIGGRVHVLRPRIGSAAGLYQGLHPVRLPHALRRGLPPGQIREAEAAPPPLA